MSRYATAFRTAVVLMLLGVQGVFGADPYISVVPIGTGPNGELAAGAVIDGSTITLTTDGINPVPVFLEFRVGDWDPDDVGVKLAGFQPAFDSTSFTTGASGTLTVNFGSSSCGECSDNGDPCFSAEDCTPGACGGSGTPCHTTAGDCTGELCVGAATCDPLANGNDICEAELGTGALCGPAGYFLGSGTCSFAYTDASRPDFALAAAGAVLPALDISSTDVRPAYAVVFGHVNDPEPFPAEGLYAATLALFVPPDAQGTFTVSLKPYPASNLTDGNTAAILPLDVIPAQIRVNPGRCCWNLQLTPGNRARCTDGLTENECDAQNGVTFFEAGGTCDDACPEVCGDNINNQLSEACDGADDAACPGACQDNCLCGTCGDGIRTGDEVCDGDDDAACPGLCLGDCTCGPFCGDDVVNQPSEDCDGADDAACPGLCLGDCTCGPFCGDDVVNQPSEDCDGTDDNTCVGICLDDCTCNPTCGDGGDDADMLGVAIFMNCFTGPGGGPVSPECHCAEYDSDDDVDLDDLFGFYDILNGP